MDVGGAHLGKEPAQGANVALQCDCGQPPTRLECEEALTPQAPNLDELPHRSDDALTVHYNCLCMSVYLVSYHCHVTVTVCTCTSLSHISVITHNVMTLAPMQWG